MRIKRYIFFITLTITCISYPSCLSNKNASTHITVNTVKNDSDKDGVNDAEDLCPDIKGEVDLQGCPDRDGDGIIDSEDKCPDQIGLAHFHGCPIPDTDKDGINDYDDKCPEVFGYARYQGCPVPDTDGDGVNDEEDKCINEVGTEENRGCPEVPADADGDGVPDENDSCKNVPGPVKNHGCPVANKINKYSEKLPVKTDEVNEIANASADEVVAVKKFNGKKAANSAQKVTSDIIRFDSMAVNSSDSNNSTSNAVLQTQTAELNFSFFKTIQQQETKNLDISFIVSQSAGSPLNEINAETNSEFQFIQKNDTSASCALIGNAMYKNYSITLVYNKSDFDIVPANNVVEKVLDFKNGNTFSWQLNAIAEKSRNANVILQLNAESNEGIKYVIAQDKVTIKITAKEPRSLMYKTGYWIGAHAGYILAAFLLPLAVIIFLSRKKREKRER